MFAKRRTSRNWHSVAFDENNWITVIVDNTNWDDFGGVSYDGEPPLSDEQLGEIARVICGIFFQDKEIYDTVIASPEGTILSNDRLDGYPIPYWKQKSAVNTAVWSHLNLPHDEVDFVVSVVKGR